MIFWLRIWHLLMLWVRRWRGRREMAQLTPRLLRDIGLTQTQARSIIDRPFWKG